MEELLLNPICSILGISLIPLLVIVLIIILLRR